MGSVKRDVESFVLGVHWRNGGTLEELDFSMALLDRSLGLDSLDLAEVMVAIERAFGCSPFERDPLPRTWRDVVRRVKEGQELGSRKLLNSDATTKCGE